MDRPHARCHDQCFVHCRVERSTRRQHAFVAAMTLALIVSGCATVGPGTPGPGIPDVPAPPSVPAANPNPPSNVNLQGFPLPYRQGYADGCATVAGSERKDAGRFRDDGQYRTGWQDGLALCKKR